MPAVTAQSRAVDSHTDARSLNCLQRQLESSLVYHAHHPEQIDTRLGELREEWDIERTLEANAASLSLLSIVAGLISGRRAVLVAGAVSSFLLQHAVQGWCPPLPFFRKLGVRTKDEILQEYYGLRLLRDGIARFASMQEAAPRARVDAILAVLDPGDDEVVVTDDNEDVDATA